LNGQNGAFYQNAGNLTGTLGVLYGGTGATATTGTGNNVLSANPTLTGTVTAASISASGAISSSNYVGLVSTAAQPKITSVGTLTSLSVSGKITNNTRVSFLARGTASAGVFTYAAVTSPSAADLFNGTLAASCYHILPGTVINTTANNFKFTAPYAGYYVICIDVSGFNAAGRTIISISIDSSSTEVLDRNVSATTDQHSYSIVLRLSQSSVITPTYNTGTSFAYPSFINFSGHLLYEF
jgi:hypothetical protein